MLWSGLSGLDREGWNTSHRTSSPVRAPSLWAGLPSRKRQTRCLVKQNKQTKQVILIINTVGTILSSQEYTTEPLDKKTALQAKIELAGKSNLLYLTRWEFLKRLFLAGKIFSNNGSGW